MSRRGYDRRRQCAEEGCKEWSIVHYDLQRDYRDAVHRERGRPPWMCSRHAKPEEVLSVENPLVVYMRESEEKFSTYGDTTRSIGTYWDSSGFVYGPGFKAWAKDFPPGTKLIVTARIELPESYTPPPPAPGRIANAVDLDS